jgi:hypothetical protein
MGFGKLINFNGKQMSNNYTISKEDLQQAIEKAYIDGANHERTIIVSWLRNKNIVTREWNNNNSPVSLTYALAANAIEHNEHHPGKEQNKMSTNLHFSDDENGPEIALCTYEDGIAEGVRRERAAVVVWLRERANAPHPIERGISSLSPAGRGLLLLHADGIERGEHRREGE